MDKKTLKSLPLSAFNEEGWLKPPLLIYINLIFMAKGLLIFIASLASLGQGDQILALMYPEKSTLYIAIALSIIPLATLVSFTLGELQDRLKWKKILILLCVAEVFGEISFMIKVLLSDIQPLGTTTFKLLTVQLILLALVISSKKARAFFNQIIDEKAILKD